ncbi:hypothetical protein E2C01_023469 [Portunus trituberculatus]|uniref:Uncharacterized protein n=1 Tax=Portunus trituberculatus TaxID=210409 RepID=A0A5B7E9X2_PORTR|nr:hypothetical protein [Portunus trituberculatus]
MIGTARLAARHPDSSRAQGVVHASPAPSPRQEGVDKGGQERVRETHGVGRVTTEKVNLLASLSTIGRKPIPVTALNMHQDTIERDGQGDQCWDHANSLPSEAHPILSRLAPPRPGSAPSPPQPATTRPRTAPRR